MAERLGNVLYWFGSGVSLIVGCGTLLAISYQYFEKGDDEIALIILMFGAPICIGSWLFGRVCRYVLAGR